MQHSGLSMSGRPARYLEEGSRRDDERCQEARVPAEFHDIGALVLFLRITPWQVPGFDPGRYDGRLRALHERLRQGEPLRVTCHRFAIVARPK